MKANATRTKKITVKTTVEIISHRLCTESLDANGSGALWITLKRKCCLCGKRFQHGDSVSICMYLENGEQYSGGVHTGCLIDQRSPTMSTDSPRYFVDHFARGMA